MYGRGRGLSIETQRTTAAQDAKAPEAHQRSSRQPQAKPAARRPDAAAPPDAVRQREAAAQARARRPARGPVHRARARPRASLSANRNGYGFVRTEG